MTKRLLDVEKSATGQAWQLRVPDMEPIESLKRDHSLDDLTARLLVGRGIDSAHAEVFLNPTVKNSMIDPSRLKDMDKAAKMIWDAIQSRQKITVFADYDVDGATSAAQIIRWARHFDTDIGLYVPDRVLEGYGPSVEAFEALKADGNDLIITVDCGATAKDALMAADSLGMPVIVIDHHLMDDGEMPPHAALVNPNRPDDTSGLGHLAAAGVTFYLLVALNREARARGIENLPDLFDLLGLTALGTICDVVPLQGINRAFTKQGLSLLSQNKVTGIKALADIAQIEPPYNAYHAGFVFGPRINAGGRIGQADMGARLLSTDNAQTAYPMASELDAVNSERKRLQDQMILEATDRFMQTYGDEPCNIVIADMEGWHPGIIGIIAGRLKDKLQKPVIVIGIDDNGVGKGSGRSIAGVNLGKAISAARDDGLLVSGGGHAMAGGLSIEATKIDDLRTYLDDMLAIEIIRARANMALEIDALIHPKAVDIELLELIDKVSPFGSGNPEPVFALADLRIAYAERLRGGHVRCTFESSDGSQLRAICFRADDTGLSEILLAPDGPRVHVAGKVKENVWKGRRRVDFIVDDVAAHQTSL